MTNLTSPFQEESPKEEKTKKPANKLRLLIPAGLLLVGAGLGVNYWLGLNADKALKLSGRIEGYETDVGTKVSGKIELVTVREGDAVKKGQVIVQLDDEEVVAQLAAAKANLEAAQEKEVQAKLQIDVIQSQIKEAQLYIAQSDKDSGGRINQAQASVASAEAQLAQALAQQQEAQANLKLATSDRDRYQNLLKDGVISEKQYDDVETRYDTATASLDAAKASVKAAQKQVDVATGGLTQAQTSSLNPEINTAKLEALQKQLTQGRSQLIGAQAEVNNAKAQQREIASRVKDLNIVSPIDGVVITRMVEPGEVVASGKALLTVVNLNDVYLRGYIPEGRIGEVKVGQKAKVFLDSDPTHPIEAQVNAVDPQASFTPENIYFKEDRVKQVFGLKLTLKNPGGYAKPGMPADGEIITEK